MHAVAELPIEAIRIQQRQEKLVILILCRYAAWLSLAAGG
jgi:hypothetical protein